MILALEYINDEGVLNIAHLNPDGTVDYHESKPSVEDYKYLGGNKAQISVVVDDHPKKAYHRLGEIRNPTGGDIEEAVADMLSSPMNTYNQILKVYVETCKSIGNDEDD